MNLLTQFFESLQSNPWVQNVGWTLLHSLWQVTLIAILYAVASCAMRSRSASLRYVMGCIAMATMLLMPLATFYVLSPVPEQVATKIIEPPTTEVSGTLPDQQMASTPPVFSQVPQADPVSSPDSEITPDKAVQIADAPTLLERASGLVRPWLPVLTVCWLVGVMLLSLRPVAGCLRVRTLRRTGLTALCEPHAALTKQLMNRLGIRQAVQFAQSALVEVPTVIGYLRPMVLLPASAVTGLTTAELELILAHELAHIRRHDYAVNLIQTIIEALLFYHPAMWWLSKDVRRERENCCDDVAVSISGDRTTYIRALAQLEEHRVAPPALAATGGSLLNRVQRLVGKPEPEFVYRKSSLWLTALIMVSVTLTAIAFASVPSDQLEGAGDSVGAVENEDGEGTAESSDLNIDKLIGKKVAQLVRDVNYPFVDEQRLQDIEKDFTNFINSNIPYGTYAVGASIPEDQRKEILRAIEKHGAQHLGLDRFRQTELRSINSAYLKLPDRLMTLKWKLYRAIENARKLDQEKQAKLGAQRSWMRKHVQSLPPNRFYTHEQVLSALEERLADPLACTLAYPMTDEQFDLFRQGLKKYAPQGELNHVVSHIVQQSLNAQYRDFTDFETPFKDRVVSYGGGRVVKLGFEQNRPFESSLLSISDIEESNTVINAVTGSLVTVPDDSRRDRSVEHWLNEEGRGDFGFDDARGGGLFAVRGAKLVKLDVKTWHEADAISNKELRALLNGPSAGRTVSLGKHYQDHQHDNGAPYCYAGVLTKEGQLAVAAVEGFSGRSSIDVRTRVRSALSEMKTAKLSDEEVNSDRTIKAPKDVTDVQSYKDGGTTSFILHRPGQQPIRVCFDYRDQPPVEESSWKTAGNLTLGRMFTGADYPEKPNAKLVKLGSEEEKRLLNDLNAWLDQQLSKELQSRMLSEVRSAESLRRLAATMGKSVDDLRELSSLLRKTRQYELVFVQSNGVYVTLERQAEPQANPSRIPPLLISVVNRGDIEKLTFGQTDQAFELEVDGKWYRQGRREYKSSPLPPGRIYDPFPLTLDQRWQHESAPLKLSPGQHTIRVRCSVAPLSSNRDASLATSQPMTVTVGPQRAEKESATDPEQTSQAQPDHKQLPLDIQNACRDHLRTMPPTKKLSARARSIDHARLQVIAHHIAKEKAIALLQVGGPEQVDPGSNRDNNETFWCCQLNRKDKAPANGGWKVTDTQVVSSVIKYRALEIAFAQENRSPYPPGSTKSRRANVNGPDGAGLADVLVKAFVFGEFEPVLVAKTDREGHFLLPNSPPGVEPTNDQGAISRGYRLEFSKPGCLPWKKNVFVNLDADGNYDRSALLMRKSTVVSGKLLGVDGKPLAGKKVRLRSIILYPDTRFEDAYDWTETKPDGSFRYENVWPGRHLAQSWQANDQEKNDPAKGRTAAVIVETSDFENGKLTVDDVVLDLSKSFSTLAVTVLDQDGQPVPKAEIDIIWRPLIGQWGGGSLSCSLLNEHYPKVKTNDAGKATLTGLPPGVWEIRAGRLASDPWKFASERLTFKEGDKLEATLQFSKPIDPNDFDLNSIHIR